MRNPTPEFEVRDARPGDHATIVAFNRSLAAESEGKVLDPEVLGRGVARALADPGSTIRYWVAAAPDGSILGMAGITREWSDWRNGWIWWFQSVYVAEAARSRGVFRAIHAAIRSAARAEADVIGLRLYVEDGNDRAQRTYRALGLEPGGYSVFEELWPERYGRAD